MECKIVICLFVIYCMIQVDLADCKLQEKGSMSKSNTAKSHDRKQFDRVYKTGGKTKINKRYYIRPKLLKEDAEKPSNHKYKTDGQIKMDRQDHVRPPKLQNKDDEKPFVHTSKADNLKKSHTKDKFRPKLQKSKLSNKKDKKYKADHDAKRRRKNHLRPKQKFVTQSQTKPKSIYKGNKFIGRKKEIDHYTEVKELVKSKRPQSDTKTQLAETTALLKEIMKTNKRLKNQNKRLKRIWAALEEMCKALNMKTETSQTDDNSSNNTHSSPFENGQPTFNFSDAEEMYFISITSSGTNERNEMNITVEYKAPPDHSPSWWTWWKDRPYLKKNATKQYRRENMTFVSSQNFENASEIYHMVFELVHKENVIAMTFTDEIKSRGGTVNMASHVTIAEQMTPIIAPLNENLNFSLFISGNFSSNCQLSFDFLAINTSKELPELVRARSGRLYLDLQSNTKVHNTSTSSLLHAQASTRNTSNAQLEISLSINNNYSGLGGILSLFVECTQSVRFVDGIYSVKRFEILSNISGTLAVVPSNSVAVSPLQNIIYVYPKSSKLQLTCFAMGNPKPDVVLAKMISEEYIDVAPVYLYDSLTRLKVLNLTAVKTYRLTTKETNIEGKYTCRVPGHDDVSTTTEVIVVQEAKFNRHTSGVTMMGDNKVEVRCEASGKPNPEVEIRLYNIDGPDLTKVPDYKVSRSSPDPFTTIVDLTISPPDPAIHLVHCVSLQDLNEDYTEPPTDSMPLKTYVGDDFYFYWDLYNEFLLNSGDSGP